MSMPASAGVIHKWLDENGITHYSDEAPRIEQTGVTLIEVPERDITATSTRDDYYSIANQWQRMHRERIERDRLTLEKQRQKAAQSSHTPEVVYVEKPDEKTYVGIYSGLRYHRRGAHRPHRKPAFRHATEHPNRPSRAFYRMIQ